MLGLKEIPKVQIVDLIGLKKAHSVEPLTPFNYHQWKEDMGVLLYTKKLFRLTE